MTLRSPEKPETYTFKNLQTRKRRFRPPLGQVELSKPSTEITKGTNLYASTTVYFQSKRFYLYNVLWRGLRVWYSVFISLRVLRPPLFRVNSGNPANCDRYALLP